MQFNFVLETSPLTRATKNIISKQITLALCSADLYCLYMRVNVFFGSVSLSWSSFFKYYHAVYIYILLA
jgi:hypothetical protein